MNDKKKLKDIVLFFVVWDVVFVCFAVFTAVLLEMIFNASASDSDPVEPDILQEYDILGYDEKGNAELSKEDYEDYFNRMLAERMEKIENGEAVEDTEQSKKK